MVKINTILSRSDTFKRPGELSAYGLTLKKNDFTFPWERLLNGRKSLKKNQSDYTVKKNVHLFEYTPTILLCTKFNDD